MGPDIVHRRDLFFFSRTRSSKRESVIEVRRQFIVSPAQLNRRSAAALAGRGVFSLTNRSFSAGHAAMLIVSSDVAGICIYCVSTSVFPAEARAAGRGRKKKSSSS